MLRTSAPLIGALGSRRTAVPGPTEKDILRSVLRAFDANSDGLRVRRFQRIVAFTVLSVSSVAAIVCYKYCLLTRDYLMAIAFIAGFALMAAFVTYRHYFEVRLLRPYVDLASIAKRIEEIQTETPKEKSEWPPQ